MKRRGFVNLYIVIGIMFLSITLIAVFGFPLINSYYRVKNTSNLVESYVSARNGLERFYGEFYNNISYNETTAYEDLGLTYKIVEKDLDTRNINLLMSGDGSKIFNVINKTSIVINLNYTSTAVPDRNNEIPPSYYDFNLYLDGENILSESNLSNSKTITIPSDYIYNKDTGEFNYGEYKLVISSLNAAMSASIAYEEQTYRELEFIENDSAVRTLVIENNGGTIDRYLINNK